jgi:hypothetical protein
MRPWPASFALAATLAAGLFAARGEEPAAPDVAGVPPFHRTYIPVDEIAKRAWTAGYLPVDLLEFQQLLETVRHGAQGAPIASAAKIEQGDYEARLEGDNLLVGSMRLRIQRAGASPIPLVLDPCNLALAKPTWADGKLRAAVLGAGADRRLRVLVEGSEMHADWSFRGQRTASGAFGFRLQMPRSPMNRLLLDLPAGLEPVCDQGIASKSADAERGIAQWTVELGGHHTVDLRLAPEDSSREQRPLTLLRQTTAYEFTPRGVNVGVQLRLDVHGEPLHRIVVDVDPSLRLIAARYGETEIPWSLNTQPESGGVQATLQLPEPVVGSGRVVQLSGIAPLQTGKRWRLPTLRPQDLAWQEGTAQILIPSLFLLEQLETDGCRQSRLTALPAPLSGESVEVQYFRPTATVDVVISQPRERPTIDLGSVVEAGTAEITSRCGLQLSLSRGQRRTVKIDIRPSWIIDSVENLDATGSPAWEVEEPAANHSNLKVVLAAPIRADRPARLLVRGHRAAPPESTFEGEELRMLAVDPLRAGKRFIAVRAMDGAEVNWTGVDALNQLDVQALSPAELKLFPQPLSGQLFAEDSFFGQARLSLKRRRPTYSVNIRVDAAVQQNQLAETYTIQCTPEVARVDRLLVHLSQARTAPIEWSLAGGNTGDFSARRLSAAEQLQTGLPPAGEVWELNLQLTKPGAFELRGVRSVEFAAETPLALASVADAVSQRGTVAIRALGQSGLSIRNRRLTSVPVEMLEADRFQTARAAYHYQPGRDDLEDSAALSVAPAPATQSDTGIWAWQHRLESRYGQQELAIHWSTVYLQTGGRPSVKLWLPDGAKLLHAWVDDRRLSTVPTGTDQSLSMELPPGRGFVTISLSFTTPDRLPSLVGSYFAPFPRLDSPVLARQWTIWTPTAFSLHDGVGRIENGAGVPPTWHQRLWGALGRSANQKLFNPLSPDDWKSTTAAAEISEQAALLFLETLGKTVSQYANAEALTWGQLLALASENQSPTNSVLVDVEGLARVGVGPQTRVRAASHQASAERGRAILRQAQLRLLVYGNVLLVSASPDSLPIDPATPLQTGELAIVPPHSPLAGELRRVNQAKYPGRLQHVATWLAAPPRPALPWSIPSNLVSAPQGSSNWTVQTLDYSSVGEPRVRISRSAAVSCLAWAIFLGVVAAGYGFQRWNATALVSLLAASSFVALVIPAVYAAWASSVVLACLACLIGQCTSWEPRTRRADRSRSPRPSSTSVIRQLARTSSFVLVVLFSWSMGWAQPPSTQAPSTQATSGEQADSSASPTVEPAPQTAPPRGGAPAAAAKAPDKPATAHTPIYRVYVPVDERQQPVGGKYFVSQELYSRLAKQAAALSDQHNPWLLSQASYRASLARDPVSRRLLLAKLAARLELQVLRAGMAVRLPFTRGTRGTVVSLRLDGRPQAIAWNETGTELILGPLPVDRYRIELELQPSTEADSATAGFDLAIPPVPLSTLELNFPPDAPPVEIPSARGAIRVSKERGELVADLGSADRLAVRWPVAVGMDVATPNLEVDELLWVKVRPGTTVVDARFKYRVLGGSVRRIQLLADPRLRLLPPTNAQSLVADVRTIPGEPQKVELELRRPASDEITIDLSFLVANASGVGNLRLPRLETSGARSSKRMLAVSVDAALQPSIQAGEDSQTVDIGEFLTAWGASESRPQAAFAVPRGEPVWVLATQPNEPRLSSEQTLSLSLGRTQALVQFDALVTISGGHSLQLGLQGPPGLMVESVSLLEDDLQRVSRWSVNGEGRITVFLSGPLNGRHRLALRGRWNFGDPAALAHPFVEILGAKVDKREFHVYRQPAVLVQIVQAPGMVPINGEAQTSADFGSVVGRFTADSASTEVSLTVAPNEIRSRGVMATIVERAGDAWNAELHYHLHVQEGLVDSLQFDIPPQWSEPFRVDAPFKVVPIPGELRRQLILYPPKPVSDKYQLRVRGRVAPSAGDRLRVPDIRPLGAGETERFVVLPQQRDRQQITWETLGLTSAKLPLGFAPGRSVQNSLAYQVTGESFQASLRAVERATAAARVTLADIHVVWQRDGHFEAVGAFDVDPGGTPGCTLLLPGGCRLLRATVEGLPSQAVERANGHWRMMFQSQQLPQHVEVVYAGPIFNASGGQRRFPAPQLENMDVGQTLWRIDGPSDIGAGRPVNSERTSDPVRHELGRLASISSLVRLPAEVTGEHLPEEIARWYRSWRSRFAASRAALRWNLHAARQSSTPTEATVAASQFDAQLEAVDGRLRGTSGAGFSAAPAPNAVDLLQVTRHESSPTFFHVAGQAAELTLVYPQPLVEMPWPRWLAAICLLTMLGVAAYLLVGKTLPAFAPWFVAGSIGLVGWLLLAPSAAGLALFAVACLIAVRAQWQIGMRSVPHR